MLLMLLLSSVARLSPLYYIIMSAGSKEKCFMCTLNAFESLI